MRPFQNLLLLILFFSFGFTSDISQTYRFDGKYGLVVNQNETHWEIKWLTPTPEKGQLIVDGQTETTPSSITHAVKVPIDADVEKSIQFGGEDSGLTRLALKSSFSRKAYSFNKVDSLFVLGDTHGNFDEVSTILKNSGLINEELEWTGGTAHLVFVGDILDRGDDALRLAWLIYDLEQSAMAQGGNVHLVLGNHEIMVMSNDIRYISEKEQSIAERHQIGYQKIFDPTMTLIGRWMASKPAVLKIDDAVFAHGGYILNNTLREINDQVASYLRQPAFTHLKDKEPDYDGYEASDWEAQKEYFYGAYSPFWFRGYVRSDTLGSYLDFMLTKTGSKVHIVGHTPQKEITALYDGKLIATNVENPGTEMLLLTKRKRKYIRQRIGLDGEIVAF